MGYDVEAPRCPLCDKRYHSRAEANSCPGPHTPTSPDLTPERIAEIKREVMGQDWGGGFKYRQKTGA